MRNFKLFLLSAVLIAATIFIYSCAKENNHSTASASEEYNKSLTSVSKVIEAFEKADLNATISPLVESRSNSVGLPTSSPCFEQPEPGSVCSANHITTTMSLAESFPRPA